MIYNIRGRMTLRHEHYAVVETGGVGFKFFAAPGTIAKLPDIGNEVTVFTYLYFREDAFALYGFLDPKELNLFERLNGVGGIGPKSALNILGVAKVDQLAAAINEGKTDLLTRASGIGRKTAERIILELKGKLNLAASPQTLQLMEADIELEDALVGLGMTKNEAKVTIAKLDPELTGFKERLKAALKKK